METLQDCFEFMDSNVFTAVAMVNHHTQVEEYAESVSAYIQECMEDVSVIQNISARANKKPLMTIEVHAMLKACHSAFKSGSMIIHRTARANLNCAISAANRAHGQKVQDFFQAIPPPARTSISSNSVTTLAGLRQSTPLLRRNVCLALMNSHLVWTQLMSEEP